MNSDARSRVLYVGRVPHGFYEQEMRSYFSQFGAVSRLRLSRNRRTGASKHYAFIEFQSPDVAQIAAETMDGYLLFGHLLQCKIVPCDKIHPELFKHCNSKFRVVDWKTKYRTKFEEAIANKDKLGAREKRRALREQQARHRLSGLGIATD